MATTRERSLLGYPAVDEELDVRVLGSGFHSADYLDYLDHPEFHGKMFFPKDPTEVPTSFSVALLKHAGGLAALLWDWEVEAEPAPYLPDPKNPKVGDRFMFAAGPATVEQKMEGCRAFWVRYEDEDHRLFAWMLDLPAVKCVPLPPLPKEPEPPKVLGAEENTFTITGTSTISYLPASPTCCCADDEPGHLDPRCHLFVRPKPPLGPKPEFLRVCACLRLDCKSCTAMVRDEMNEALLLPLPMPHRILPERRTPVVPYRRWDAMIGIWP